MLYILTGKIQTGKTRWLQALISTLEERGVQCSGVVAPGVWRQRTDAEVAELEKIAATDPKQLMVKCPGRYEKLGIDNELLPSHEIVHFARRRDLELKNGTYQPTSQSGKAGLGWAISDEAIEQVNANFDKLASGNVPAAPGLLIVDELGMLELHRNQGLTSAMAMLEAGPSPIAGHALIIVREDLAPLAQERFTAWDGVTFVYPTEETRTEILGLFE